MHDLVIRNASILDGLGGEPYVADLAVQDGRIAEIGKGLAGREAVDADGLALMPGIIDNHTHYDAQITWDPALSPSPSLGVTTAVIGNCGFTIAPCRAADRDLVMKNLTQVEGMSLEVLRQGIRWDFESIPEYFDALARRGCAINVAGFVGHSSLRSYVMGEDAPRRAATKEEVARMRELLLEGMRTGAVGFATSTSPAHNGEGGLPMPSRLADEAELRALTGALKDAGRGIFMLTKGGQTKIAFLEELAAACGRPFVVAALLHNSTNPRAVFQDLDEIRAANGRGRRMLGAISCCPLSMDFTMRSPYVLEGLESWKPALPLKGEAFKAKLAERVFRDGIRAELSEAAHFRLFNGQWDQVEVVESRRTALEQRSVGAIARETGRDPLDVMLDLALEEDLGTVFNAMLLNSDEAAVGEMLRHPASLVSLSDAGAHLTFFNDAGFGLHLLGHWVRERGALKPGYAADLLLFDPQRVGRGAKQRVFDLPGGNARLTTAPVGVHGVWVNGQRDLQQLPGRVLREFDA